jgi:uncharacterized protein YkwD
MRRIIVGALTAVLLLTTAPAANAVVGSPTYQAQILAQTNVVRTAADKPAVKMRTCLDTYANSWAKYLATQKKTLTHRPTSQLQTIMKKCGLDGIGENLAFGYSTGTAVVNAWVKSPGHQKNQMNAGFTQIGIGAYRDSKDRYYAVALYGNPA